MEQDIERLESEIAAIDNELSRPEYASDAEMLLELSGKREEKEAALTLSLEIWEQLAQQLENEN